MVLPSEFKKWQAVVGWGLTDLAVDTFLNYVTVTFTAKGANFAKKGVPLHPGLFVVTPVTTDTILKAASHSASMTIKIPAAKVFHLVAGEDLALKIAHDGDAFVKHVKLEPNADMPGVAEGGDLGVAGENILKIFTVPGPKTHTGVLTRLNRHAFIAGAKGWYLDCSQVSNKAYLIMVSLIDQGHKETKSTIAVTWDPTQLVNGVTNFALGKVGVVATATKYMEVMLPNELLALLNGKEVETKSDGLQEIAELVSAKHHAAAAAMLEALVPDMDHFIQFNILNTLAQQHGISAWRLDGAIGGQVQVHCVFGKETTNSAVKTFHKYGDFPFEVFSQKVRKAFNYTSISTPIPVIHDQQVVLKAHFFSDAKTAAEVGADQYVKSKKATKNIAAMIDTAGVSEEVTAEGAKIVSEEVTAFGAKIVDEKAKLKAGAAGAMNVVPLSEATQLGQRVKGSSEGSVYRVFLISGDLKFAGRFKEGKGLSVRVEGKFDPKSKAALANLNFSDNNKYQSIHMTLEKPDHACLFLGGLAMMLPTAGMQLPDGKTMVETISNDVK